MRKGHINALVSVTARFRNLIDYKTLNIDGSGDTSVIATDTKKH